jgi:hypothetical protein
MEARSRYRPFCDTEHQPRHASDQITECTRRIVGQNHRMITNDVLQAGWNFRKDRLQKSPAEAGLPSGRNAVPKGTAIR